MKVKSALIWHYTFTIPAVSCTVFRSNNCTIRNCILSCHIILWFSLRWDLHTNIHVIQRISCRGWGRLHDLYNSCLLSRHVWFSTQPCQRFPFGNLVVDQILQAFGLCSKLWLKFLLCCQSLFISCQCSARSLGGQNGDQTLVKIR